MNQQFSLAGLERHSLDVGLVPIGGCSIGGEKQQGRPRDSLRPAVGGVVVPQGRDIFRRAAVFRNSRDWSGIDADEIQVAVVPPIEPPAGDRFAERDGRASLDGDLFQRSTREECEPLAVGRENRHVPVFRPRQRGGVRLVHHPDGEPRPAIGQSRWVSDPRAVSRDCHRGAISEQRLRSEIHIQFDKRPSAAGFPRQSEAASASAIIAATAQGAHARRAAAGGASSSSRRAPLISRRRCRGSRARHMPEQPPKSRRHRAEVGLRVGGRRQAYR